MTNFTTLLNKWPLFFTFLGFILVWGIVSSYYPTVILPSPSETLLTLVKMSQTASFWETLWMTLCRFIASFCIAFMIGTAFGIVTGKSKKLYPIVRPVMMVIQSVPPVSWILLAILWMGINGGAQTTVVVLALLPVFFFNSVQGIQQVPIELLETAQIFQVGVMRTIRGVYLPALKPYWSSAVVISIGIGWKTIVMAEVISGQTGIGAMMNTARIYLKTEEVMAWTLLIVCFGISMEAFARRISGGADQREV